MAEKRTIKEIAIQYSGLFTVSDLYKVIKDWAFTRGYDFGERIHSENITEKGKDIHIIFEFFKKVSDYEKYVIETELNMNNLVEVILKRKEKSQKVSKGEVSAKIAGYLITDYENRWQNKPMHVFIRTIVDKVIMKVPITKRSNELVEEVKHLHAQIEGILNLFKYKGE